MRDLRVWQTDGRTDIIINGELYYIVGPEVFDMRVPL